MGLLNIWVARINQAHKSFLFLTLEGGSGREHARPVIFDLLFSPLLSSTFPSSSAEGQAPQTPDPTQFTPHDRGHPHHPEAPGPGRTLPQGSQTKPKVLPSPSPTAGCHGAQLASLPALTGWLWRPTSPTPRTLLGGTPGPLLGGAISGSALDAGTRV